MYLGGRVSGVPTPAINDSQLFQGIPSLTRLVFGEVTPSLGMAESVIDFFSDCNRSTINARLLSVAPQNIGRSSVSLEPNVEYQGD